LTQVETVVWRRLKQRGGSPALCGTQPFCLEVLKGTRLDQIGALYPARLAALNALDVSAASQAEGRR
jgi:anti-anti-sigma regulatory factor